MSTASQSGPRSGGTGTAYVVAGGRVYPEDARPHARPKRQRGAQVLKRLSDRIRDQFHERFILDIEGAEYTDNATLLQDYQYDIELIRKACEEFCDMLRRLYRLNTRFEFQEGWSMATDEEAVADAEYRNWSSDLKLDLAVGDYALSTRITTLVDEAGPAGLEAQREKCLTEFIQKLYQLLDQMVEQQLIGLIVFGRDHDCDFHFFRDVLIEHEVDKQTMAYANPVRWDNHPDDGEVVDLIGVQFDINKARSVVRRTRTDVYLREIRTAPFGRSRMPIPPDIHRFIETLPGWLQEICRIVEGERHSEQFFDCEIENHYCWDDNVHPFHSRVIWDSGLEIDSSTVLDPALTLGHYVLTGWDGKDVEEQHNEQAESWRKDHANKQAGMAEQHSGSMLMAAAISLIVTMLGFNLLSGSASQLVGAIGATAFTACGLSWFHSAAQALHKRTNGVHFLLAGVGCIVFIASLLATTQAVRVGEWKMLWIILFAPLALYGPWKLRELLPDDR